jgi:methionyl-tRNA formyltransferase
MSDFRIIFFGELDSTFSRLHFALLERRTQVLLWVAGRLPISSAHRFGSRSDWWQRFQVRARFEFQVVRYWGKPFAFLNRINVPIRYAQRNDPELATALNVLQPDLIVSAGYRWLLPKSVLAIPKLGAFNCHPSPLPRYAGSNPWFWMLANGETESAVTIHRMVDVADAGNIVRQRFFPIAPTANHQQLYNESSVMSARLLEECLDAWAKGIVEETPQDLARRSFFPSPQDDDYRIDWNCSAAQICNLVRASSPAPGAWAMFRGRRFAIRQAESLAGASDRPGAIVRVASDGVQIACGNGSVRLKVVTLGDRELRGAQLAAKLGLAVGECLE